MKKYNSIDLFKFILAFFVVTIHTMSLPEDTNSFVWILLKSAVPFYFMVIGFLLMNKINKNNNRLEVIKDYIYKILKLYLIWSIIYFPITLYNFFIEEHSNVMFAIINIVKNYVIKGDQFYSWPLWYLLCTIYSLIVIYILNRLKANKKVIIIVSIVLYIIGWGITTMVTNINSFNGITYKIISIIYIAIGNGRLFQGMLYINIGMILYDNKERINKIKYNTFLMTILTILLLILNYYVNIELLKILLYIFIFLLCICINLKDNNIYYYLRKTGVIMYFTHMLFFFIYSLIVGFDNCKGIVGFSISIICTIMLSIVINIINKNKDNKIINALFN